MAQKITPPLNSIGKYTVKAPFVINSALSYECIAIRTFEDMYKAGFDVYEDFYKPAGLTVDSGFDFNSEVQNSPNIISLKGSDGSILYIPDTFILSIPAIGDVSYSHVLLGCSLGMLPDSLDLTVLLKDVADFIGARIGHTVDVKLMGAPSFIQPTQAEHEALETAREAAVTVKDNLTTQVIDLQKKNALLVNKLDTTMSVLKNNNLLRGS